jgi:hypothetical protein
VSKEIDRVYCNQATWVGTECYPTMPPVEDSGPERRALWQFEEATHGVLITYTHTSRGGSALIPWGNVRSVTYKPDAKPVLKVAK